MRLLSLLDFEKQEESDSLPVRRLHEAAIIGDVSALLHLLQSEPLSILSKRNPLHVAVLLGHSSFVQELLSRNPKLAADTNSNGSLPIHVASAKGYVEIVKELLVMEPDGSFVWDHDGRTPLHLATIKGRMAVINELIRVAPESARVLTKAGESVLHLCVRHNRVEAMKVLVDCVGRDDGFLNSRDSDGNSVLHLAVSKKQLEIIKYLLANTDIESNSPNAKGLTPLSILSNGPRDVRDMEIKHLLSELREPSSRMREEGNIIEVVPDAVPLLSHKSSSKPPPPPSKHKHTDWLGQKRNALMIVASLIATVAFQGTLSPPGGFWQDDFTADPTNQNQTSHKAGMAVMVTTLPIAYGQFVIFNTLAFLSSLSIILLLVSGLPMRRRGWMWTQMVIMWIAMSALSCTYFITWIYMTPKDSAGVLNGVTRISVLMWLCMIGVVFIGNVVRMVRWLMSEYREAKEKKKEAEKETRVALEKNNEL